MTDEQRPPVADFSSVRLLEEGTALRGLVLLICCAAFTPLLRRRTGMEATRSHLQTTPQEATVMAGVFARAVFVWILASAIGTVGARLSVGLGVVATLSGVFGLVTLAVLCKRHLGSRPKLSFGPGVSANALLVLRLLGLALVGSGALSLILPDWQVPDFGSRVRTDGEWLRRGFELVLIAPLLEELLFRWLLYSALRIRLAPGPATVVSSLAFALGHANSTFQFADAAWFGGVMALSFERSGKTGPLVVAHALYNLYAVLFSALLSVIH